ncbi:PH domain-containing protein [Rubrobacter indicoceani]|uniref:PH domain-containing protein n=1 Tax=Rubrobacter indicoceani TaxID=2051957 RepID=UPI000E5B6ADD|nr:PH domain-containing protein [Rubrobacter indicoceani]
MSEGGVEERPGAGASCLEPSERLDPRARTVWRINNALWAAPIVGAGCLVAFFVRLGGAPLYLWTLPVVAVLAVAVVSIFVTPALRWRRWRYEIRPDEVDLQRGIFFVTRTLVPLARIQHVDTQNGPLQRHYGLATVVFYTAAGANQIPELSAPVAADVRERIAALTKDQDEL